MIPWAVDALFDKRPVVNWLVFGGLVLVFVLQGVTAEKQVADEGPTITDELGELKLEKKEAVAKRDKKEKAVTGPMARLVLDGWGPLGLFGHNWLHANIFQLIATLLFLWAFGNAVCGKIGNKAYLGVYLGLGLLGAIIHLVVRGEPACGASVVLSGIVGMYLVFFPENSISCFFLLPRPVMLGVSSYFVIAVWFIVDIFRATVGVQCISYFSHAAGFVGGVGLAFLMLRKKWVVMEKGEKSLLQMLEKGKEEGEEEESKGAEKKEGEKKEKDLKAVEIGVEMVGAEKSAAKMAVEEAEKTGGGIIRFVCSCGKKIKAPREYAGKRGKCPKCHKPIQIPSE